MKRRRFLHYAGTSGLSLAFLDHSFRLAHAPSGERPDLRTLAFEVDTVDRTGNIRNRQTHTAQYFSEPINSAESLEMVAIQAGQFWMGAAPAEIKAHHPEYPRHRVKIAPFFLSKYPVTQAQWAAVATLPKVTRELDAHPSHFIGRNLPVESISWLEAMEFCDRLGQLTGRHYQLPSETQWEYACRAATSTPFHTGDTITSQFADYIGSSTYQAEHAGEYRQSTMPVGQLPPNAFGLHDMHGNVWEWCADVWHANYQGAPRQGQVWATARRSQLRSIRGGGWLDHPARIRSASRSGYNETHLNRTIGFRVSMI